MGEETEAVGRTEEEAGEAEGREIYNRFEVVDPKVLFFLGKKSQLSESSKRIQSSKFR